MDRAPGMSVRLKLTLSYAGFLMLAGASSPCGCSSFLCSSPFARGPSRPPGPTCWIVSLPGRKLPGAAEVVRSPRRWFLAGRMLAPRPGSPMHAHAWIALPGSVGGPRMSSANSPTASTRCSHGSKRRSPNSADSPPTLPTSCALHWLSRRVFSSRRNDPNGDSGELVDRLRAVNARAIDL